jgi:4-hydroxy-2-oxoglutarate aldolase
LSRLHGYGKAPRRPLLPLGEEEGAKLMEKFKAMIELEKEYA